jgi:S-adenosylmethionine:diacylglycerol 3-amino-3-carboxypropyl transferase
LEISLPWPLPATRISRFILGRIGRHPATFAYVTQARIGAELLNRAERSLTRVALADNFFVEYILTGAYTDLETSHPYLRASNFQFLKDHVSRVTLKIRDLRDYLLELPSTAVTKFNLSNIFEYMSEDEFYTTAREFLRTSRGKARIAYWSLFVLRPLPMECASHIYSQPSESVKLLASSRTFFYGGFHVWHVHGGTRSEQARAMATNTCGDHGADDTGKDIYSNVLSVDHM